MNINIPPTTKPLSNHLKRWILILFVALIPSIVSFSLITFQGYHVADFLPNFSDEVSYWTQINTYRMVGLNGGYFTLNELAPQAEFTHFYTYGPWYPALYGTFARIMGPNPTTLLVINASLLGIALIVFCIVARLDNRQMLWLILMLATMWGLLMYLFTAMQEAYQQMFAVLIASVFVLAFRDQGNINPRTKWIGLLLISVATLMRLSWAILFLPFMFLTGKKTYRYRILYILVSLVITVVIMLFASYTGAPGDNTVFDVVSTFRISFFGGLDYLFRYLVHNLGRFFFLPKRGTDVLQTYQVVVLIFGLAAFVIQSFLHRRRQSKLNTEIYFHLYNLAITVLAACALYLIGTGGDYRLLACHLMVSLLIMIALKRYRLALLIIATNILFIWVFWGDFQTYVIPKYTSDHSVYLTFQQAANDKMQYNPRATNAWCNTMLFSNKNYNGQSLDATPAGIGIGYFRDPEEPILKFKSRYLLLKDDEFQIITHRSDAPQLSLLADLPIGGLYLNENVDCSG